MTKSFTNLLKISQFHAKIVFILALSAIFVSRDVRAEDWGPYLGPSFPSDVGEIVDEDDYTPATISSLRSAKQLPLPAGRRTAPMTGRQSVYLASPDSNSSIIPQSFFDEDSPSPETPSKPKKVKKSRTALETGSDLLSPEEAAKIARPSAADTALNDGEILVDEFSFTDETYPSYGGVYDECSPAMSGYYTGPMMMKPFGTGVLDNLTVFGGVCGFKSRLDAGRNGNFGFHEGINWAGPATPQCTVSAQLGFRAVQSDINGNSGVSSKRFRNQYFVTAGLFKRDLCYPVQGGVAFDMMEDDYYGKVKVRQFRCELSARTFSNLEYGFFGGFGVSKKGTSYIDLREDPTGVLRFGVEAQNYYQLFVRKHFCSGGVAEFRGGVTERGDVVLSAMSEFPMNEYLTLTGGFNTMIPKEGRGRNGFRRESWDLSMGLVIYFRGGACSKPTNPCRPMFEVAGNGSFVNDIVRK